MGAITPGQIFAHKYQIERVLGQGGMGVVALARHLDLQTRVALKLLEGGQGAPDLPQRLLREGRAAARLQGEHVARVLDTGMEGDSPFLVMEYVRGQNLAQMLAQRGPLPREEAVDLVLQACEAIAEAHTLGIIHRDLKPSNLMLSERPDGTPLLKVLDFGISKNLSEQGASLTGSTVLLGSPKYIAPEQVRDARAASPPSDVWSLGVTLYELLTGQAPFDGPVVPGILAQIVADPPLSPRDLRPDLPAALGELLLRCLSKAPEERPMDAVELASLLAPFGTEAGRISARRAALTAEHLRHLPPEAPPGAPAWPVDPGATAPESWPADVGGTAELGTTVVPTPPLQPTVRLVSLGGLGLLLLLLVGGVGLLGTRRSSSPQTTIPSPTGSAMESPPTTNTSPGIPPARSAVAEPSSQPTSSAAPASAAVPSAFSMPPRTRPPTGPRAAPAPDDDLGPRLLQFLA